MEIIAQSKYIRMSPRKLRLVADAVRSLSLSEALAVLENLNKRATRPILDTFKQAIGNAVNNFGLEKETLEIKEVQIKKGPTVKRWRAVSRGRARTIKKRTSHIKIVLKGKKAKKQRRKSGTKG